MAGKPTAAGKSKSARGNAAPGVGTHGGQKRGLPHGFVSKAQWRYFFANPKLRAQYAHKEAHKTPGGPRVRYHRLPTRKGGPTATTARR